MKIKFKLLGTLLLMSVFSKIMSMEMEEDSRKRKRDQESEELIRNIRSRIELSDLPPEVRLHILNQGILSIIKHNAQQENGVFHPLKGVKDFIDPILQLNTEYRSLKDDLLKNTAKMVKQVFAPEFSNNSQEEQVNLDNELKAILEGEYNQENEIRAAQLLIAGANPTLIIDFDTSDPERVYSHRLPIIAMISMTGKFSNLIPLLKAKRVDLDKKYTAHGNPLVGAIENKQLHVAKLLLENGANPNVQVIEDETPLMVAIRNLDIDAVELLLGLTEINLNLKNEQGETAQDIAIEEKDENEDEEDQELLDMIIKLIKEKKNKNE
ncbi:ankyrin repeat domain-containing protein [Candidatus Babela massiliensis]|uniref:Ankyrin repeats containing protein n=1 Tax=Candidatus Babela massiliensis TaxID=673862 RepID=V6DI26_9BACT|nr:ankyrin repeat domain-containing protein [Candidatus Babela massiliensis]CDK30181.1 Ankyrin repeats containing protein [Candidatus Babela massiliensis]